MTTAARPATETDLKAVITQARHDYETVAEITDRALQGLAPILEQTEYTGDAETALIHHMRADVFDDQIYNGLADEESLESYFELAEKIDQQAGRNPIPVLMAYDNENDAAETALVMVKPGSAPFYSIVNHESDIQRSGFRNTIAETCRTLSLLGRTATVWTNLLDPSESPQKSTWVRGVLGDALVLSKTRQIDGQNHREPAKERVISNAEVIENKFYLPEFVVGWEEVTSALGASLEATEELAGHGERASKVYQFTSQLMEFLERAGELESFGQKSKPFGRLFKHAKGFEEALINLPTTD